MRMTRMIVHPDWCFNMLRIRRLPTSTGALVACASESELPDLVLEVDVTRSTSTHWKLELGMKEQVCRGLRQFADYDEDSEGWVVKEYEGVETLAPLGPGGGAVPAVSQERVRAVPEAAAQLRAARDPGRVEPAKPELAAAASEAAAQLRAAKDAGAGLLVCTGAGMSVMSGVPVFRNADGSMSAEFLAFLSDYNAARRAAGLSEADDWFSFSVPGMFDLPTEREAWAYWRWRILRARVDPAADYSELSRLTSYFGEDRVFVHTSNCDGLHVASGTPATSVLECHGSLRYLQCSAHCSGTLTEVDAAFIAKLAAEPDHVPRCPACPACLRPNVMIFGDGMLEYSELEKQDKNERVFLDRLGRGNWVVLEVGAGVVVASIRRRAEGAGASGRGLIRVNPEAEQCAKFSSAKPAVYTPLVARSADALAAVADALGLPPLSATPQ